MKSGDGAFLEKLSTLPTWDTNLDSVLSVSTSRQLLLLCVKLFG